MEKFTPAVFTDEVKEVFGTVSKSAKYARIVVDNTSSFAEEISRERAYLIRTAHFLFLSQTLVVYLLQTHAHSGSIDGNIDPNQKSFTILTHLSLHTSNCNE